MDHSPHSVHATVKPASFSASFYSPSCEGQRQVLVCFPPAYFERQQHLPLIVAFHGKHQTPEIFRRHTGLADPAVNRDYIVAYPASLSHQWSSDPSSPLTAQRNDLNFVNDLLDFLLKFFPIDPLRVFLAGFSNGAGLAALVACHKKLSRRIAGIALSSCAVFLDEAMEEPLFSKFEATRFPIPMLEFHGDADPLIDYNGVDTTDGPSWPIGAWIRDYKWMQEDGLGVDRDDEGVTEELFDGKVDRMSWRCGTDRDVVVHYLIHGFGHGWPTTTPLDNDDVRHGPTVFDAAPIVIDFFNKASAPAVIVAGSADQL